MFNLNPKTHWGKEAEKLGKETLSFIAKEVDEKGVYNPKTLESLVESKLIAPTIPKEYGGLGGTETECQEIMEQITKYNTSAASMITCQLMAANAFFVGASEEQKNFYLPKMADGSIIGVPSITYKDAGSDVAAMVTTAIRDGDDYVLNGTKTLISFLGLADIYLVFAKTNTEKGHKGISAFIVDSNNPNLEVEENFQKMGQKGMPTGTIRLNNCRVKKSARLGKEGEGFFICMGLLNRSRIIVASQAVGVAMAAYSAALKYAKERKTFGKTLSRHQVISFKLADMAIKLYTARLAAHHAAQKFDAGEDYLLEVSVAKVYASEISREIVNESLQIHGGIGYTTEYEVERLYRDQRIIELYGGSSEIQRIIISKQILS